MVTLGAITAWMGAKWAVARASPALWVVIALVVIVVCGALSLKLIVRDEVTRASTAAVKEDRAQSSLDVTHATINAQAEADNAMSAELANLHEAINQTRQELKPVLEEKGKDQVSPARQAYIEALRRRQRKEK